MERRFVSNPQSQISVVKRADEKRVITGYAAVFYRASDPGTEYQLWSDIYERIAPTAFDRALKEDDTRGLFNHDRNFILGLKSAGTVRLSIDNIGLRYEIDPPDTQLGRDLMVSIERGDIPGSSFAFRALKQKFEEDPTRDADIRIVEDAYLYDVSPVTDPAYKASSVGLRSANSAPAAESEDELLVAWRSWKEDLREERDSKLRLQRARARMALT